MIWTVVAAVVALTVLVLLGGAIFLASQRLRQAREAMEQFAARYGLPFTEGDGPAELTVSGEVEGRHLEIATRDTHRPSSKHRAAPVAPHTSYRAPVDLGPLDDLSFRPDHIGAVDRGLTLGRSALDDPYIFDGRPQHLALAFLARSGVGDALERLHDTVPGTRMVRGELDTEREGYPQEVSDLEAIADPLVACAEILSDEAEAFDPAAIDGGGPTNLDDFPEDRRSLVDAWSNVAEARDLAFVAADPGGDVAVGGTYEGRDLSIGTRGSAEKEGEPHALLEIEAGADARPTLVVKAAESDWRLVGLHDDPIPVDCEEVHVDDEELDATYEFFSDAAGDGDLLEDVEFVDALEAMLTPDRVVDLEDRVLRVELERAPRTKDDLTDILDKGVALARSIDA